MTSEEPKYFPPINLDELSCAPTREIKLHIGFFNGSAVLTVHNPSTGGFKNAMVKITLRILEFISVMRCFQQFLRDRVLKNPNSNVDCSIPVSAYNAEAQNKRALIGDIGFIYSAESKKIALKITSKGVDGLLFPIYPSSNIDMSGALSYTEAGGKAEALFLWVNAWFEYHITRAIQLSVDQAVHKGNNPRPRNNNNSGGGRSYGGGNSGYSGGNRGSGMNSSKDDDDDIPF